MGLAESRPEWVVGFLDESWFTRLARPSLNSWSAAGEPLRRIVTVRITSTCPFPKMLPDRALGYEQLKALKPSIILTSISGLGQTGPHKDRAMFDAAAQAMSGLAYRNGKPDDPPMFTGVFLADYIAGAYAAYGTMVALFHRERTGEGQVVDLALLDSLFSILGVQMSACLMLGEKMPRTGNRDLYTAPARIFEARDGYIYLHGGTDSLFKRLTSVMNQPELAEDPRFATSAARMENVDALEAIVSGWVEEVSAKLEEVGIPYGPWQTFPRRQATRSFKLAR